MSRIYKYTVPKVKNFRMFMEAYYSFVRSRYCRIKSNCERCFWSKFCNPCSDQKQPIDQRRQAYLEYLIEFGKEPK